MAERKRIALLLCGSLLSQAVAPSLARADQILQSAPNLHLLERSFQDKGGSIEYTWQPYPGAVLMPINLWGSVGKSGIYRVPLKTDLVTLITLAAGPTEAANMESVVIRRQKDRELEVIKIDAKKLFTDSGQAAPILEANDVVYVPPEKPFVSNNVVLAVSLITSVLSIVVSAILINTQLKNH